MPRARLVIFALALFFLDQSAQAQPSTQYFGILATYRHGDFEQAVSALERLPARELDLGVAAAAVAGVDGLQAAALLHIETAMSARVRHDREQWQRHEAIATGIVRRLERIDARSAFTRTWRLLVVAFLEGQGDQANAVNMAEQARRASGDSALLALSVGAAHDMAWAWKEEDGVDRPFKGSLGSAISHYRAALAQDQTLLEARVRLGRALAQRGDIDEALTVLAGASGSDERGFVYLARLFEGDALERRGDVRAAEQAYGTAIRAMPRAQSAQVALAHLQHAHGNRPDAAERIQATASAQDAVDTSDPWFWYTLGMAWRVTPYLAVLRDMVTHK